MDANIEGRHISSVQRTMQSQLQNSTCIERFIDVQFMDARNTPYDKEARFVVELDDDMDLNGLSKKYDRFMYEMTEDVGLSTNKMKNPRGYETKEQFGVSHDVQDDYVWALERVQGQTAVTIFFQG